MGRVVILLGLLAEACFATESSAVTESPNVVLVVGAAGESAYGTNFARQAELWRKAADLGRVQAVTIGIAEGQTNDLEILRQTLEQQSPTGPPLWLVLIGHGSFDGKQARFNLRGPDLSATNLAAWLKPFRRTLAIINSSSSSSPFLNALSATNRVIITATRSGSEQNYARLGGYLAAAIADPAADLDKDGQVSLLEAFLLASRQVTEFYRLEGRLATEHGLLDDNGDGLGTQADWFRGLRVVKRPKENAQPDGALAASLTLVPSPTEAALSPDQRARRDSLEKAVRELRDSKDKMREDEYYDQLEKLLLELARLRFPDAS